MKEEMAKMRKQNQELNEIAAQIKKENDFLRRQANAVPSNPLYFSTDTRDTRGTLRGMQ